jgi:predicted metal-binding protein
MKDIDSLASMYVCDGCCCGRVEKGHNEVPVDFLKSAWKKKELYKKINLTISNCLGYCSLHNVTMLKNGSKKTWIGKLNSREHFEAVITWAHSVAEFGNKAKLPNILVPHLFLPSDI